MLKAKRIGDEKKKNEDIWQAASKKTDDSKVPTDYVPQRQDHCYIYDFIKKSPHTI